MISLKWKLYIALAFVLALVGAVGYSRIVAGAVDKERARRDRDSLDAIRVQKHDWKDIRAMPDDAIVDELTGSLPRPTG